MKRAGITRAAERQRLTFLVDRGSNTYRDMLHTHPACTIPLDGGTCAATAVDVALIDGTVYTLCFEHVDWLTTALQRGAR